MKFQIMVQLQKRVNSLKVRNVTTFKESKQFICKDLATCEYLGKHNISYIYKGYDNSGRTYWIFLKNDNLIEVLNKRG